MAWLPFASTLFGALAGFIAGLFSERFKVRAVPIDKELDRIDMLHDEAFELLLSADGKSAFEAELRKIAKERGRLGQNLRRELGRRKTYPPVQTALSLFAGAISKVERSIDDPPADREPLRAELEERSAALRKAVRKCAAEDIVWKILRGS